MKILIYFITLLILVRWVQRPSFVSARSDGPEELEQWLKNFHWGSRGDLRASVSLPTYKFYGEIIETLLGLARKLGGNYQDSLLSLREGLQCDRQFEKRLSSVLQGAWFQMGLMCLLTWGFILGALNVTGIHLPKSVLICILGWQCCGLGALPLILRYFRKKYFSDIGALWKILYILAALMRVPLARSEVMRLAGVQGLREISSGALQPMIERLKEVCRKAMQEGLSYGDEIRSLQDELRFQEKWHFELFEKRLGAVKLGLLAIFFLPAYLAFVMLMLRELLATM